MVLSVEIVIVKCEIDGNRTFVISLFCTNKIPTCNVCDQMSLVDDIIVNYSSCHLGRLIRT